MERLGEGGRLSRGEGKGTEGGRDWLGGRGRGRVRVRGVRILQDHRWFIPKQTLI